MIQTLVGPGEFNQPSGAPNGNITAFYMRMSAMYPLGPVTYTNFRILFLDTTLTTLPASFVTGLFDTVYFRASVTMQAAVNTWLFVPLDHPHFYNNAKSLLVQIEQCGASGTFTGFSLRHTNTPGLNRRSYSVAGCPFSYQGVSQYVSNCGIYIPNPLGISNNNNQVPLAYRLDQNYPNPFNPVTTINFGIPKSSNVKLAVYDLLGREVQVLVNEFVQAGNHSVDFDASNFSSGVYFYTIRSGDFTDTKKMALIK
jgi:hypothetical protein